MEGTNKHEEIVIEEGLLYKLLDVKRTASEAEIRKGYKLMARRYHPDKNQDDPEAKVKFQRLSEAYKILSDPRKRHIYDTTGEIDGEGVKDISKFIEAYVYYREKYREVTAEDIDSYRKIYVGGEEEEEDLLDYFERNEGDMTLILQAIPYSSSEDIDRFIEFFEVKFKAGEFTPDFRINFDETKDMIEDYYEELEEDEAAEQMKSLREQILGNMGRRSGNTGGNCARGDPLMIEDGPMGDLKAAILGRGRKRQDDFLQSLESKYANQEVVDKSVSKRSKKRRKRGKKNGR